VEVEEEEGGGLARAQGFLIFKFALRIFLNIFQVRPDGLFFHIDFSYALGNYSETYLFSLNV
jgi:hypothetical protein